MDYMTLREASEKWGVSSRKSTITALRAVFLAL